MHGIVMAYFNDDTPNSNDTKFFQTKDKFH